MVLSGSGSGFLPRRCSSSAYDWDVLGNTRATFLWWSVRYVSADAVRRLTSKSVDGRNYGDQEYGYEVNTDNIMPTLKKLGLTTEEWHWRDYRNSTKTRRNAPKRYVYVARTVASPSCNG